MPMGHQLMSVNQYPMVTQQPVNNYPIYPPHSGTPQVKSLFLQKFHIFQPMIYNPSSFNYSPMAHPNLQPHQHHHHHQQPFQQFVNQSQQNNQQAGEQQAQNVYQASYMIPTHPMMQPTVSGLKSFSKYLNSGPFRVPITWHFSKLVFFNRVYFVATVIY